MKAKEWLDKEEWENVPVDSQKWSHYTMMDKIMEEYAKVYLKYKLEEINKSTKLNKFL
tara:strand:- start:23 stop:196 length:174 start_codon:yes stop_codon:yes gene_type:complete